VPVVFIHGVATRRGAHYDHAVRARDALFRRYVYEQLHLPASLPVTNAFWGDDAAEFRWGNVSVPAEGIEGFGAETPFEDVALAEFVDGELENEDRALISVASANPESAFDLLWSVAAIDAHETRMEQLVAFAHRASGILPDLTPADVLTTDDERLLKRFVEIVLPEGGNRAGNEAFGADEVIDQLSEGLIRIRSAAGRLSGRGAVKLLRSKLHENAALFFGDVMTYLNERGLSRDNAGPIATKVIATIDECLASAPQTPLVIVAHSMGGNIAYDILSQFRPDIRCDALVTVGSQVGLFEELCLLARGKTEGCPDLDKVAALPNVSRWINVFDYNDVLGFAASKIFDGVDDYAYSTGKGVAKAHSSYFVLPSFYRRLAARLGGSYGAHLG
jgi:hypothetical protein